MTTKRFLGGIPTAPDVDALMREFDGLKPGDLIPYEQIEKIVQVSKDTSRFKTVTGALRRALSRQRNIDLGVISGEGYKVLSAGERVTASVDDFHRGARKIRRSAQRLALTPLEALSEPDRQRAERTRRLIEGTYSAAREASKTIAIEFKPPRQLPRSTP